VRFVLALALALAACHKDQPPAPTAEQAEQLNDAENLLNDVAANEEGPEQSPGPSNSMN
jgi:hypothetical protein